MGVKDGVRGLLDRGAAGSARLRRVRRALEPASLRLLWVLRRPARPLPDRYGYTRGRIADRRYVEQFLTDNADAIAGHCLEIQNANYVRKFGGDRVVKVDVLDIDPENAFATIVGDLHDLTAVESDTFDCVVLTSVLQFLRDPPAALREVHRILAPGGTALVTVPTLPPLDFEAHADRWRFMPTGARELHEAAFGADNVSVTAFGNLLTAVARLTGLAEEDLPAKAFAFDDGIYPVVVGVRATKAAGATGGG